jgi:hypothetical protein
MSMPAEAPAPGRVIPVTLTATVNTTASIAPVFIAGTAILGYVADAIIKVMPSP